LLQRATYQKLWHMVYLNHICHILWRFGPILCKCQVLWRFGPILCHICHVLWRFGPILCQKGGRLGFELLTSFFLNQNIYQCCYRSNLCKLKQNSVIYAEKTNELGELWRPFWRLYSVFFSVVSCIGFLRSSRTQ
jgi:hypothetical protein